MIRDPRSFAQRLRIAMEIRGVSVKELAHKTNSQHKRVINWRTGRNGTSRAMLPILAKALDVSPSWLATPGEIDLPHFPA